MSEMTIEQVRNTNLRRQISRLAGEIREYNDAIADLEKSKKESMEKLIGLAGQARVDDKLVGSGWQLLKTVQRRKTIRPEKLVAMGVDVEVVEAATEIKEVESWSVRKREER